MKWNSVRVVAPLFLLFFGHAQLKAVDETPLVRTEVDGAEETEMYVPIDFKVEKVLAVPESQGSWVSMALDNKGRFITSDQQGLLYRVTLQSEGKAPLVEPLSVFVTDAAGKRTGAAIGAAQGLLWAFDSLYVVINGNAGLGSGLYRLRSSAGNDTLDTAELLMPIPGSGEHGPHGIALGPDNYLYICAGNDCGLPKWQSSRVPRCWGGDQLLAPDAQGQDWHSKNTAVPGGWVCRVDRDGKDWEIYCAGFRNHYRLAFNPDGELFTSDGDNEWQIGMPWYRPPRICHVTSGGDFGWRSGVYKWPAYFPDGLSSVADLPTGGPSGIVFGTGAKFPARYQKALFALDWAYGKIYAVHLAASGPTYTGTVETFMRGRPLAIADALIGNDGAMYFIVGGRSIESTLYRVTYVGHEDTSPVQPEADGKSVKSRELRRALEALHVETNSTGATDTAWQHLSDENPRIRFAARVALEHQDPNTWQDRLFSEQDVERVLTAAIALARCGDKSLKSRLLNKLSSLDWARLSDQQRIEILRAYALVFIRMEKPDRAEELQISRALNAHFPSHNDLVDRELSRLLVFLKAEDIVEKTLPLLRAAPTQQEQIQLGYALKDTMGAWTTKERDAYADWLNSGAAFAGCREIQDVLKDLKQSEIASAPAAERENWERKFQERSSPPPTPRRLVKLWTVAELAPLVKDGLKQRDYEKGRFIYKEASCIRCHYFNGEGTEIGPDLTSVSARFNPRAILESIIEPNKVISDQYSIKTLKMKDGRKLYGRVLTENNDRYEFAPDPMEPGKSVAIHKTDVDAVKPSAVSLMPEGLLNGFTQDEVLDLMAFLNSVGDKHDKVFTGKGKDEDSRGK